MCNESKSVCTVVKIDAHDTELSEYLPMSALGFPLELACNSPPDMVLKSLKFGTTEYSIQYRPSVCTYSCPVVIHAPCVLYTPGAW